MTWDLEDVVLQGTAACTKPEGSFLVVKRWYWDDLPLSGSCFQVSGTWLMFMLRSKAIPICARYRPKRVDVTLERFYVRIAQGGHTTYVPTDKCPTKPSHCCNTPRKRVLRILEYQRSMPRLDGIFTRLPIIPRPVSMFWRASSTLFRTADSLASCSLTRAWSLALNLAALPFFRSSSARSSASQSVFLSFLSLRFGAPFAAGFDRTADVSFLMLRVYHHGLKRRQSLSRFEYLNL